MSQPIIDVRDVSKRYQLGAIGATSLKDEISRGWDRLRGREPASARDAGEFWALRDVSFSVQPGEVVGVIGRNGAGKSTLLKILSRITQQTTGAISLRGRVASLLEIGTGFHPDLTGRENVFLNGAILGMTKAEIRRKFDEIVAFAEVGPFIDTPVKRYSSGMYVRLAFAIAAHLEPEILIVDEVLAVGDVGFQKKCLGKMGDVSRQGRTVLFVSHHLPSVEALCHRALLLEDGRITATGPSSDVVRCFLSRMSESITCRLADRTDRLGVGTVRLVGAEVSAADGGSIITSTSGLKVTLHYRSKAPVLRLNLIIGIYSDMDHGLYGLESDAAEPLPDLMPAEGSVSCVTGPLNLTAGPCVLNVAVITSGDMVDYLRGVARFNLEPVDYYGSGKTPARDWMLGLIPHRWTVQPHPHAEALSAAAAPVPWALEE